MVNLVAAQKPLMHWLMKQAGVMPHIVEIEEGTVMNFWVPTETVKTQSTDKASNINGGHDEKGKSKTAKPVVVLIHGFAAEGIVTWQFQVGSLTKKYSVYVPDLLFFGGSTTSRTDRSKAFQAECVAKGLRKLGVKRCIVVGFSYGGMVAFEMAEKYPELIDALVISGSCIDIVDSKIDNIGFNSSSELLLPTSVEGLKNLFKVATYRNIWFPDRLHRDFLEVMFNHREERAELLDDLANQKGCTKHKFQQKIHLLWGENDQIFLLDVAQRMKGLLGEKVTLQGIKKAGHLVHLERPCAYNRCLKEFLATLAEDETKND
ncbi:hypothetical protein Sjap_016924 [Stephania japonica]|uniref:AB hydrolase-1 domain-containing protein n=1 Tax=Stephania japonica TaxID=461633 RepID=A0AAP0NJ97_9MAGN